MKTLKRLFIPAIFILAIVFMSSSCSSRRHYCASDTVKYQKKSRIKAYKPNSSRSTYAHGTPVKKKYVLKK